LLSFFILFQFSSSHFLILLDEPKPKVTNQEKKNKADNDTPSDFLDSIIDGIVAMGRLEQERRPLQQTLLPAWSPRVLIRPPRILVCAPSNAAVDEILARIVGVGFLDGSEKTYRPHILRVGHSTKYVFLFYLLKLYSQF
jgi:hypothetical protein